MGVPHRRSGSQVSGLHSLAVALAANRAQVGEQLALRRELALAVPTRGRLGCGVQALRLCIGGGMLALRFALPAPHALRTQNSVECEVTLGSCVARKQQVHSRASLRGAQL